jgi:hypothetical protein
MHAVREEFGWVPLPFLMRAAAELVGQRRARWVALAVGGILNAQRLPWFAAEWWRSRGESEG